MVCSTSHQCLVCSLTSPVNKLGSQIMKKIATRKKLVPERNSELGRFIMHALENHATKWGYQNKLKCHKFCKLLMWHRPISVLCCALMSIHTPPRFFFFYRNFFHDKFIEPTDLEKLQERPSYLPCSTFGMMWQQACENRHPPSC